MLIKNIINKGQTLEKMYFEEKVFNYKGFNFKIRAKTMYSVISMPLIPLTLDEKTDIGSKEKPSPRQLLFKQTPAQLCLCG